MIESYLSYPSKEQLVEAAAAMIVVRISQAVYESGKCFLALAGGTTPSEVYASVVQKAAPAQIPWDGVHLFWGDERCVPPDHPDSNYRMVHESLLRHVPIPEHNVHRIMGELKPAAAAERYSQEIADTIPGESPAFDVVLLGMGYDGHTASLFPGSTALDVFDDDVAAVFVKKHDAWRVTLTYPILNRSEHVLFLVAGASKAAMVERINNLEAPTRDYPASLVNPSSGDVRWMMDRAATALI